MRALTAFLVLGVLVLVHELAHLAAARAVGARAVAFSFGIGPPLAAFRALGHRWLFGAVPWGGWLRLEGENPHADRSTGIAFGELRPWRQLLVFAGGPAGSLLVTVGLLTGLYLRGTHVQVPMTLGTVSAGSEAARAGLRPGDRIRSVAGAEVRSWSSLSSALARREGALTPMEVEARGDLRTALVRPTRDGDGQGRIGISEAYVFRASGAREAVRRALRHTGRLARRTLSAAVEVIVHAQHREPGATSIGPLVRRLGETLWSGVDGFVRATSALGVALSLFYLLPLPALDGGRMLLTAWEAAGRGQVRPRVQTALQLTSLLLAVALVAWIAGGEVRQVFAVSHLPR